MLNMLHYHDGVVVVVVCSSERFDLLAGFSSFNSILLLVVSTS